jgi:hypothetical protein
LGHDCRIFRSREYRALYSQALLPSALEGLANAVLVLIFVTHLLEDRRWIQCATLLAGLKDASNAVGRGVL